MKFTSDPCPSPKLRAKIIIYNLDLSLYKLKYELSALYLGLVLKRHNWSTTLF